MDPAQPIPPLPPYSSQILPQQVSKRVKRFLELRPEIWSRLEDIGSKLLHEDVEETMEMLIDMGTKAIQLTTSQDRMLKMVGGTRQFLGQKCPTCGQQQVAYTQEAAVQVGRSLPPERARAEPKEKEQKDVGINQKK